MISFEEKLKAGADKIGLAITEQQALQFARFYSLLLDWNNRMNLTSLTEADDVVEKHFLDSLLCSFLPEVAEAQSVIDVGSGAGFPGIPLKIAFPHKKFVLLDSLKKRIIFLENAICELNLPDIAAVHGRAEEYGLKQHWREQYDLAIARAVAELPVLCELCLPFVRVGGHFIAMKGPQGEEELKGADNALKILGGTLKKIHKFTLPFTGAQRVIIAVKKTMPTPSRYPRRAGVPEKKPL